MARLPNGCQRWQCCQKVAEDNKSCQRDAEDNKSCQKVAEDNKGCQKVANYGQQLNRMTKLHDNCLN